MSLQNIQALLEKAWSDPELQDKIRQSAAEQMDRYLEALVAIGAEAGYPFSKEELLNAAKAASSRNAGNPDELDDTQLESVAGGISGDVIAYSIGSLFWGCLDSLLRGCDLEEEAKKANQPPGPFDPSY